MDEIEQTQDEPKEEIVLRYVGNREGHGAHVFGVPKSDLTQSQIDASGYTTEQLCEFSPQVYEHVNATEEEKAEAKTTRRGKKPTKK